MWTLLLGQADCGGCWVSILGTQVEWGLSQVYVIRSTRTSVVVFHFSPLLSEMQVGIKSCMIWCSVFSVPDTQIVSLTSSKQLTLLNIHCLILHLDACSTDFLNFFVLLLLHNMLLPILKRCLDEAARANSRSQNTQNISGERLVFEQISEQASITASWAMISLLTFYSLFFVHAIFLWFLFLLFFFNQLHRFLFSVSRTVQILFFFYSWQNF